MQTNISSILVEMPRGRSRLLQTPVLFRLCLPRRPQFPPIGSQMIHDLQGLQCVAQTNGHIRLKGREGNNLS